MALTRDFRETVQARVRKDPEFRRGLLRDAIESFLADEAELGRELLRDYINATVGFPELAEKTGIHAKTLHKMFGPKGNPTLRTCSGFWHACRSRRAFVFRFARAALWPDA